MNASELQANPEQTLLWRVHQDAGLPVDLGPRTLLSVAAAQEHADAMVRQLGFAEYQVRVQSGEGAGWCVTTGFGVENVLPMTRSEWKDWLEAHTEPLLFGLATEILG